MIDVDDVIKLSELELCPESVPPSVVRDMATALRILGNSEPDGPDHDVLDYFGLLNDVPISFQEYIDKKHGNHL